MKHLLITLGLALSSQGLEIEQQRPAIQALEIDEQPIDFIPEIPFPPIRPPNGCRRGYEFDSKLCACVPIRQCGPIRCRWPLVQSPPIDGGCNCITQEKYDSYFDHGLNDKCLPEPKPCCGCCCDCCDHDDEVKCPRGYSYNELFNRCQKIQYFPLPQAEAVELEPARL